jgi:hypothetical protein
MDEIERLREFGVVTASARVPNVNVTARVLRTIRERRESRWSDSVRPLASVLAASWMSVLVTGYFVQEVWTQVQDPLTSLVTPFVVALR